MIARLLRWLSSLFASAPKAAEGGGLFDPDDTFIYTHLVSYTEAGGKVFARKDPLKLWQRVMEQAGALDADMKVARSQSSGAAERYARGVARLREMFEIPPFDQGGLPDRLLFDLYVHFMQYTEALKKNTPAPTTSAGGTSPGSPDTSSAAPSVTPTTAGSGSTATAVPIGPPTPPASGPASPTAASGPAPATTRSTPTPPDRPGA